MDDANKAVKITLTGKISYTDQITVSQAAQIITLIDASSAQSAGFDPAQALPRILTSQQKGRASNPREALDISDAKTIPEKIVAFALYVSQEGDKATFTLEDIKPLFRRAREAVPGNINRDLSAAIKAGWVAEAEIKGEFYVTDKAAKALDTGFESIRGSRSNGNKARATVARKPRKGNGAIPAAFQNIDMIAPTISGLPDYHKLTSQTERFLWAVYAAKEHGVTSIDNQDVVWLTDHLGDGIPSKDISARYLRLKRSGYLNRSLQDNKIRITPAGEEHLRSLSSQRGQ